MSPTKAPLLNGYRLEIFRPECNPLFQSLHCIARLDEDVGEVLPFLNAELGGVTYTREPPSVTFMAHGKLITVQAREIAVNALRDRGEAEKIVAWMQREINEVWENREAITPRREGVQKPKVLDILKRLPGTNCRECGAPTCMVFAVRVTEGVKGAGDCTRLTRPEKASLAAFLSRFGPGWVESA